MTEVTQTPPMSFRVDDLMNPRAFSEGPFVVFWNASGSTEYVEPGADLPVPPVPEIGRFKRLRGFKPWRADLRIAPPVGDSLEEFGQKIAAILHIPTNPPGEDAKAIWLPGMLVARNAGEALGSTGLLLRKIEGVMVSSVQVKVWAL